MHFTDNLAIIFTFSYNVLYKTPEKWEPPAVLPLPLPKSEGGGSRASRFQRLRWIRMDPLSYSMASSTDLDGQTPSLNAVGSLQ